MIKKIIAMLIITIGFIACSATSYTVKISQEKLQNNISKRFPIQQNVMMGSIALNSPIIKFPKDKNKLVTGLSFEYKPPFFPKQSGLIEVGGGIKYDKKSASFFLKNPSIESMKFNNISLGKMVPSSLKNMMSSLLSEIFAKYPIYKIQDDSLKGKLYKKALQKVEIKDSSLQLTLGL